MKKKCEISKKHFRAFSLHCEFGISQLTLTQEMIHKNNMALQKGRHNETIAGFDAGYGASIRTSVNKYKEFPPSGYHKDGYNLYLRITKYKLNRLLFLSNPLVAPDNNLCEQKARILKEKISQATSIHIFEHQIYFCECLNMPDHFAADSKDNVFQSVQDIFKHEKPIWSKSGKSRTPDTALNKQITG